MACVRLTACSKSLREINLSIWLNMLHDALTLGLPWRGGAGGFGDSPEPYSAGWLNVIPAVYFGVLDRSVFTEKAVYPVSCVARHLIVGLRSSPTARCSW